MSEPRGWVYAVNSSQFLLFLAIVHASWDIFLTNEPSMTLLLISTASGLVYPIWEKYLCITYSGPFCRWKNRLNEFTLSFHRHFLCVWTFYMLPWPYASPMHHNWLYPRFLQLIVASSRSKRRIAALPSLGLSTGERTARMSWHCQFVAIFSVLNLLTWFLVHIPQQCTLPEFTLDVYSFWSDIANLRGGLHIWCCHEYCQQNKGFRHTVLKKIIS